MKRVALILVILYISNAYQVKCLEETLAGVHRQQLTISNQEIITVRDLLIPDYLNYASGPYRKPRVKKILPDYNAKDRRRKRSQDDIIVNRNITQSTSEEMYVSKSDKQTTVETASRNKITINTERQTAKFETIQPTDTVTPEMKSTRNSEIISALPSSTDSTSDTIDTDITTTSLVTDSMADIDTHHWESSLESEWQTVPKIYVKHVTPTLLRTTTNNFQSATNVTARNGAQQNKPDNITEYRRTSVKTTIIKSNPETTTTPEIKRKSQSTTKSQSVPIFIKITEPVFSENKNKDKIDRTTQMKLFTESPLPASELNFNKERGSTTSPQTTVKEKLISQSDTSATESSFTNTLTSTQSTMSVWEEKDKTDTKPKQSLSYRIEAPKSRVRSKNIHLKKPSKLDNAPITNGIVSNKNSTVISNEKYSTVTSQRQRPNDNSNSFRNVYRPNKTIMDSTTKKQSDVTLPILIATSENLKQMLEFRVTSTLSKMTTDLESVQFPSTTQSMATEYPLSFYKNNTEDLAKRRVNQFYPAPGQNRYHFGDNRENDITQDKNTDRLNKTVQMDQILEQSPQMQYTDETDNTVHFRITHPVQRNQQADLFPTVPETLMTQRPEPPKALYDIQNYSQSLIDEKSKGHSNQIEHPVPMYSVNQFRSENYPQQWPQISNSNSFGNRFNPVQPYEWHPISRTENPSVAFNQRSQHENLVNAFVNFNLANKVHYTGGNQIRSGLLQPLQRPQMIQQQQFMPRMPYQQPNPLYFQYLPKVVGPFKPYPLVFNI